MGAGFVDKAMELYPALDFESYDRMFPIKITCQQADLEI